MSITDVRTLLRVSYSGERGPTGSTGPTGAAGPTGADGQEGPRGLRGLPGPTGEVGPTGAQGAAGPAGAKGDPGEAGPAGPQGIQGEVGPQGEAGPAGAKGDPGEPGPQGEVGPTGPPGTEADQSLNTTDSVSFAQVTLTGDLFDPNQAVTKQYVDDQISSVSNLSSTDDLPEGIENLYYTEERARSAFSVIGPGITYDSSTGIFTSTETIGPTGPIGEVGPTGPRGTDGTSVNILGSLAFTDDLPVTGNSGDSYLINGELYVWSGTQWENVGGIQGPQGEPGAQGEIGPTGAQGEIGPTGEQGPQGPQGERGSDGTSVSILGSVTADTDLPGYPSSYSGNIGDGYLTADGHLWVWNGTQWQDAGEIKGPQGEVGPTGPVGPGGITFTIADNTGLDLDSNDVLKTVYNTAISDQITSVSVGGAQPQPASVWKNKNIVEVLDTILFPDILPSYSVPTINLTANQTGIREIGSSVSQNLTLTTVENDAGVYTNLSISRGATVLVTENDPQGTATTSLAAEFGYANPNNPNLSYTLSFSDSVTVASGTTSWSGSGTYLAGLPKKNNKGVDDTRTPAVRSTTAPQAAASIQSSTVSITGIYPYFWGKSATQPTAASIAAAIAAGTANKVLAAATGTVSVTYNAQSEFVWLAHVSTATEKTKWYNTDLNRGDIGPGNFILSPSTTAVNSPDGLWTAVSYKIYISDYASSTTGAIEFRNS